MAPLRKTSHLSPAILGLALAWPLAFLSGCGSGGTIPVQAPHLTTVTIVTQPADASASLGQTATYSVIAAGSGTLQYQWFRNGTAIASATSATYTTPSLTSTDLGDAFSVIIADTNGQATSRSALLTLGPRSPLPNDSRFQQVAAATTAPGYVSAGGGTLVYPSSVAQGNVWGLPLSLGPGCAGASSAAGCKWLYRTFTRTAGIIGTGIGASYTNQPASNLDDFFAHFDATEVMNSLAINQTLNSAAFSLAGKLGVGGYTGTKHTVSLANLPTALSVAAAAGGVPTAISPDGANITFYSYTWTADSATYDVQVQQATSTTVFSVATALAQSGYIITASGGDGDNLFLVGTRVHGDAVPRPILTLRAGQDPQPLADGGYSVIAFAADTGGNILWYIGEK
jgi:hypothetical protein